MDELRGVLKRGLVLAGKFSRNQWSLTPLILLLLLFVIYLSGSNSMAACNGVTPSISLTTTESGGYDSLGSGTYTVFYHWIMKNSVGEVVGTLEGSYADNRSVVSNGGDDPDGYHYSLLENVFTNAPLAYIQYGQEEYAALAAKSAWIVGNSHWSGHYAYPFGNYDFVEDTNTHSIFSATPSYESILATDQQKCLAELAPPKDDGPACLSTDQPISISTGNKWLVEPDFIGAGALYFLRTYNSVPSRIGTPFGTRWNSTYTQSLDLNTPNIGSIQAYRPDGRAYSFVASGNGYITDADISDRLYKETDGGGNLTGFRIEGVDRNIEYYDVTGRLIRIVDSTGQIVTLTYDAQNHNVTVVDTKGRSLIFAYDDQNRISTLTNPAGGVTHYSYDNANNLSTVTHPDGKIRTYHYEDGYFLNHLTGITDENNIRFITYQYDTQGRAVFETMLNGETTTALDFGDNTTTVTDALGTSRTYNFATILGVAKSIGADQPGGSGCAAASNNLTYDANGNISSRTDFNGKQTCYAYDLARNLETIRAEGITSVCPSDLVNWSPAASTAQRKITTTWHTTYRLPLTITEPGRLTTHTYDPNSGNLLTQSIKDTTTLKTRTWTYTYTVAADNTLLNLLKSIDGPRPDTDVIDKTTYTYYTANDSTLPTPKYRRGDLWKITNALGHVTQITSYDGNGRPLTMVDPNTIATTLSYTPRGWLHTKTVGSKTTTYDYDAVGQLTKVTLADTSHIDYTYDAAHRLTDISDTQLNRIHYTLDAIGNRTKEEVFDASNVLSTTKSHTFDALSRLMTDITTYNQGATSTTLYTYDAAGNLKTVVEGQGTATPHTTTLSYDALSRLAGVIDPLNGITTYGYDSLDQLKSVQDPRALTTAYTLNALGDATQQTSPDSGTTHRTYDTAGNLKTATDARGIQATYTWDALNRLTNITYPTIGENITYTWDSTPGCTYGIGHLCKITDAEGSTTYSYDDQGNLSQQTRQIAGVNYTTSYSYDGANRLLSTTTPSGETQTLTRNSAGRINTLDTSNGITTTHLAKDIAYDGTGQVTAQTLGNGIQQTNSYDLAGLPATRRNNAPDGDLNGDGIVDVADVALAERMALGLVTPTADQMVHGDVAPNGTPDGTIDAADVARIRRKALGLESF